MSNERRKKRADAGVLSGILCAASMVGCLMAVGCSSQKETAVADAASDAPNLAPANFEAMKAKIQADPHIPEAQKVMLLRQMQDKSAGRPPAKP